MSGAITRTLAAVVLAAIVIHRTRRSPPCTCGHDHPPHLHYRRGTECALCPCPRYRPRRT